MSWFEREADRAEEERMEFAELREEYPKVCVDRDAHRARADAAEAECARLREAMRRQAAAVRMHQSAREQMDAHDRATLRSLAGEDRAYLIEETAAARRERDDWNARATALESERDAARAEVAALRAIVEGRAEAPDDAEIAAHRGWWRTVVPGEEILSGDTLDAEEAAQVRDVQAVNPSDPLRWWPLDATGRPTTWPTEGGL